MRFFVAFLLPIIVAGQYPGTLSQPCTNLYTQLNLKPKIFAANTKLQQDITTLTTLAYNNCTADIVQNHSCHRTYNYRYFEGDVNTLEDALQTADPTTKICWMNYQLAGKQPMKAGQANVTYHFNKADYWYIPEVCDHDDRQKLLKTAAATACQSPLTNCNASYQDPSCAST